MASLLDTPFPFVLVELALRSAVVMLAALAAATLLRRSSSARRHLVWTLSIACLLALPVLTASLPEWPVRWLPTWTGKQTAPAERDSRPIETSRPTEIVDRSGPMIRIEPDGASTAPAESPIALAPTRSAAVVESRAARGPIPWLALVWGAGTLLAFVPLAVGLLQLAFLRKNSRPVDEPRPPELLEDVKRQLGVRTPVQLRQSDSVRIPLTWGARRAVILIPSDANAWNESRLRLVLLHELAHVRRRDWLTQLAAHVACAMYWFNPLVWLAARQMRIERERACDDLVLGAGAKASDYAQELIALAAQVAHSRLPALVAVPMARMGALEDRLRGILDIRRSRSALTTMTVLIGTAFAVGAMAPLAMLRAASASTTAADESPQPDVPTAKPDPSKEPSTAKPEETKRTDTGPKTENPNPGKPAEIDDVGEQFANGIAINVMNAKGDKTIPEFRVIAGVSSGSVSSEFEKRTGKTVINWQPHTCRIGKDGGYVWPLDKAYDEMAIRVEADGYVPQRFTGIKKSKGAQHIVFLLAEDKGIAGSLKTPDGKPAAGATVAVALPQRDVVWSEGKLRGADDPLPEKPGDRWRRPLFVKTDAEGAFRLPTETDPAAAVLIVHESGVRELSYDAWKESPAVTLQKWGRIAGQVLWQDKPGAEEGVTMSVHRDEYGYPGMVASYGTVITGKDGKFTFDRVLPGMVQISRPLKPADPNSNISGVILNGMHVHAKVVEGVDTPVQIGGHGRTVTGRFLGLKSWEGATFHVHPEAPHFGFGGDNAAWSAFARLKSSPIGQAFFRDKQTVKEDGTFSLERMLPGRYQLFLSVPGIKGYAASTQILIDAEAPGQKPEAISVGDIVVVKKPAAEQENAVKPGEKPVEKPAATPVDKPVDKPADKPAQKKPGRTVTIRGKVLDDATGDPVQRIIVQGGMFDPANPNKVSWGFSEGRSSSRDGSFSTTIRWDDGWTARIVADGYLPQPVITAAPPADKDEIVVTIRLKRGPKVRGVVFDHTGKPLKNAAVFAIGPTGLNLAGGSAVSAYGGNDGDVASVKTDDAGRFEIEAGEAKSLAVSHAQFDAWPATIPEKGDLTIRLPEPARVEVEIDVDGADKESTVFYQLLTSHMPEFVRLQSTRDLKAANPGKLTLAALPPGKYQISRNVMNNLGQIGFGAMLDRQFFEVKAGETKAINFARKSGARVRGKVTLPADTKLMGIVVAIRNEKAEKSPFDEHEWTTVYASQTAEKDGTFRTERVLPGKYLLHVRAYTPLTEEQMRRTGFILPSFSAERRIEVPADGELTLEDIPLVPGAGRNTLD